MEHNAGTFTGEQRQAVVHKDGPMLVLAGPGSGKTTVIVGRVQYMIERHGILPEHILVVTFTRAAAGEMAERFGRQTGERYFGVTFGTMHAVFLGILQRELGMGKDSILKEKEKRRIILDVLRKRHSSMLGEADSLAETVLADIERGKRMFLNEEPFACPYCNSEEFARIQQAYMEECRRAGKMDFEDILIRCWELFQNHPAVLRRWQQVFRYILVDEAQDCSEIQYCILKLLAAREGNLMFVGDDDQSLYGFRGANPRWMLHYQEEFPEGKVIRLSVNFRCGRQIAEAAGRLISHNENRCGKKQRVPPGEEGELCVTEYQDSRHQYEGIAMQLREELKEGKNPCHYAILLRTNGQIPMLAAYLTKHRIPYKICEAMANPYRHWAVEDMKEYVRMALGRAKGEECIRILGRPFRGFARELLAQIEETEKRIDIADAADRLLQKHILPSGDTMELMKFRRDMKLLAGLRPAAAIRYIRKGMAYDQAYVSAVCRRYSEEEGKRVYGILEDLESRAECSATLVQWLEEQERLEADWEGQKAQTDVSGVFIMTYHGAKGLEFPCVYLPDVNEGNTPHRKAISAENLEEERRMFYVAVTRARRMLRISYVKNEQKKVAPVSRFVQELFVEAEKRSEAGVSGL